jgi:MCP family monocarboxylic acid transporter-like MFS transporter 10
MVHTFTLFTQLHPADYLPPLAGASVISRLGLGLLSDKQSPHKLGAYTMAAASVSVFLIWGLGATSFAPLLIFSIAMGLLAGGWTSLYSAIIKAAVRTFYSLLSSHLLFSSRPLSLPILISPYF